MAPVIALLALLAGLGVLLQPLLAIVHGAWTNKFGENSHGYLVLALACYFAWRILRQSPDRTRFKPSLSALIPLCAAVAAAFAAQALFVGAIQSVLVPIILGLCIALCLGWLTALRLAWPLLFLYFAMPVWAQAHQPLQNITTSVAAGLLGLIHIPFYVEGNFVHLVSGTIEIAMGCSGLNYFVAALTLAATQCTLHLSTGAARVKLMAAAALAGLCANWLRVTSLIAIAHFTQMRHYLIRVEHFWFGWILFAAALAPVVLYGRWLAEHEPVQESKPATAPRLPPLRWLWAAPAIAMAVLLVIGFGLIRSLKPVPADFTSALQHEVMPVTQFASGWSPHALGEQAQILKGNLGGLEIFQFKYPNQTREANIGLQQNSVTGDGWHVSTHTLVDLQVAGQSIPVIEYRGMLHDEPRIIWEMSTVGGHIVQSRTQRIMAMLAARLAGRADAEVWALHAACRGDCETARNEIGAVLLANRIP
jgi:exosortase